jgi:hypothetical protein
LLVKLFQIKKIPIYSDGVYLANCINYI